MPLSWGDLAPYDRLVNTSIVEPRAYQINIIKSVYSGRNSLVVLPTGLGKTIIAVFAIAKALSEGKRALIVAPTKPLSEQHMQSLVKTLNVDKDSMLLLTGSISRSKRAEMVANSRVIAATPQTFSNDMKNGRINLEDYGIVVFDECHRAVGRYAYTYIADECKVRGVQMLGLTASPGSDRKKINALIETLGIDNIEIRISTDSDVEQYVMKKDTNVVPVDKTPTMNGILNLLKPVIDRHLGSLYSHGLSPFRNFETMPKGRLLQIGDSIKKIQAANYKFMGIFDYVYVLNLSHAYDLLSSEGIFPFVNYMDSLESREEKSRVVKNILSNESVIAATKMAREALEKGDEHPKVGATVGLLKRELTGQHVIVFTQYRSTANMLTRILNMNGVAAKEFVGKGKGLSQAQQQSILSAFRDREFSVLVATSIGEEGLDVPAVDAVIFYEPIPNEIRNIQRKGRAGRMKLGTIYILMTRGTKDETYLFISRIKEKRMRDNIIRIKDRMDRNPRRSDPQRTL
ncbi:MAG: DEAD/DEAH box helicase [Candidatus Micrarchaeota archaeon]|nr:DEAD/DEAH box helicase [Candidatus Micrarchaeota archaeon]